MADERRGKWVAAKKLTVRKLTDEEARARAVALYVQSYDGRATSEAGPALPKLP